MFSASAPSTKLETGIISSCLSLFCSGSITDVNDSQFLSIEQENHLSDEKLITYYAGVSNFDSQYWLDING